MLKNQCNRLIARNVAVVIIFLLGCSLSSAYDPTRNMNLKWRYTFPSSGRSFTVADLDNDGSPETIVGLYDGTILVLSSEGMLKSRFSLGNQSKNGRIYAIDSGDINGDGKNEIVVGFGGLKVIETFPQSGFTVLNNSDGGIQWVDKVLQKTIRYIGNIYYLSSNGSVLWKKQTYNSVLDLNVVDFNRNGVKDVLVSVGDHSIDVYGEKGNLNYTNRTCEEEYIEDEYIGYDKGECSACSACNDESFDYRSPCSCDWNYTSEECYISYTLRTCTVSVSTVPGVILVEYPLMNGTVFIYDGNGNQLWRKDMLTYLLNGKINATADNNIRVVESADLNLDNRMDVIFGNDEGSLFAFNQSGLLLWNYSVSGGIKSIAVLRSNQTGGPYVVVGSENGNLLFLDRTGGLQWSSMVKKSIESIKIADVDNDDEEEIVVGSESGNIYVYDTTGIEEWYYPASSSLYYLGVVDVDKNGYYDFLVGSLTNATLYEMNKDYVLRQNANAMYTKAEFFFSQLKYSMSMAYVVKAKNVFLDIRDAEGISKCDVLVQRINNELKIGKKLEADSIYDRAVASYARNDIDSSMLLIGEARRIYTDIGDADGKKKCDSLESEINNFILSEKAVNAESIYFKALSELGQRNYTAALAMSRESKMLYEEICYVNGTILANRVITGVADSYYTDAQIKLSVKDFNTSLEYAKNAFELYNETKSYDGTAKAELLIRDIERKRGEGQLVDLNFDYSYLLYLALGVLAILILLAIRKKVSIRKDEFKSPELGEEKYEQ